MYVMKVPVQPVIVHPRLKRSKDKEQEDLTNFLRELRSCRASVKSISQDQVVVTLDRK